MERNRPGLRAALVLVVLIGSTTIPLTQVPVFKGRLDLVRTEVAVIDNRTGKAVTGLTERDFSISENGVRQTISTFADRSAVLASTSDRQGERVIAEDRRVFLFVFDIGMWDGPFKIYDGVAQFIRTKLDPQDLVGVLAETRLTQVTTDHERIAAVVERLSKRPEGLVGGQTKSLFNQKYTSEADLINLIDNWLEPASARTGFLKDASSYLLGTPEYVVNDAADTVRNWRRRLGVSPVLKVIAGIESLRRVSGSKHLVFLTRGGFRPPFIFVNGGIGLQLESAEDDRRLAARANDVGVAIDIIQTEGAEARPFAVMSSASVSEHSGGQFSGLRVAEQQLARVSEATRNGYVLGYIPSNPSLDNKYRNIKVAVNRRDATIVFRHGYTASADPPAVDSQEVYTRSRMRDAVAGNVDLKDLPVRVSAKPLIEGGKKGVRFDVSIDISSLELVEAGGQWTDELDLLIVCGDAKSAVIAKLDQRMMLSMSQTLYEQAKTNGVPYTVTIPVTGIPSIGKVVVFNFKTDRLGTASVLIR